MSARLGPTFQSPGLKNESGTSFEPIEAPSGRDAAAAPLILQG
jgi:hypothetical protein